jgi:anti-sigma factor RsiW
MSNEKDQMNALNECGRKEDLVTYLYGEAKASDRLSFERHLDGCASCRNELTAFGRVRDDLSAWQVAAPPRAEIVLRRSRIEALRELIGMFPAWVRGAAIVGAAAAMLLVALSIAHTRISFKDGDVAFGVGRAENTATAVPAVTSGEVEKMVQNAVAKERERIEGQYNAQFASFKSQLVAEHQVKLKAVDAEHREQLKAIQAGVKQEMRKLNRQNPSLRSFFAMDDSTDPWADVR